MNNKFYELADLTTQIKKAEHLFLRAQQVNIKTVQVERESQNPRQTEPGIWLKLKGESKRDIFNDEHNILLKLDKKSFIFGPNRLDNKQIEKAEQLLKFLDMNNNQVGEFKPWLENSWSYEFNVNIPVYVIKFYKYGFGALVNSKGDIFYPETGDKRQEKYLAYSSLLSNTLKESIEENIKYGDVPGEASYPLAESQKVLEMIDVAREKFKLEQSISCVDTKPVNVRHNKI